MFGKKNRLLGIDISPSAVKLVELGLSDGQPRVEAIALEALHENDLEDRHPSNIEAVADAVRKAHKASGSRLKHAAIAIPTSSVINRLVQLPVDLSESELEAAVEAEAAHYIPYPLTEVYLDFEVRGISRASRDQQDVVVVATRREYVDVRETVLEEAGLKVDVVDVEAYALENVFARLSRHLYFANASENGLSSRLQNLRTALVDIGSAMTTVYVLQGEQMVFSREQAIGCDQLTQSIAETYDMPKERAEVAKRTGELPEDYPNRVLNPFSEAVAEQVATALQFFYSSSHYNSIDGMMLMGGGGLIVDINKIIARRVNVPVTVANPFETMEYAKRGGVANARILREACLFNVASGLALRNLS